MFVNLLFVADVADIENDDDGNDETLMSIYSLKTFRSDKTIVTVCI